jgi:hypothetical protein
VKQINTNNNTGDTCETNKHKHTTIQGTHVKQIKTQNQQYWGHIETNKHKKGDTYETNINKQRKYLLNNL